MNFKKKVFASSQLSNTEFDYVFVADFFVDDYAGGAELTSEALIQSSPGKVLKIKSAQVTTETINQLSKKTWIFGNISNLNLDLITQIIQKLNYVVLEYDYKFCKYRSIEKHKSVEGKPCNCNQTQLGNMIANFFQGAKSIFWMSVEQAKRYYNYFPQLVGQPSLVLSSVFSLSDLEYIKSLQNEKKNDSWIILGSNSWIKGYEAAQKHCIATAKKYEVVWNIPYREVLQKLAKSKGFVYLPEGGDTCPRMVIEAKLLGCDLDINEHVQHATESWFAGAQTANDVLEYLKSSPKRFWDITSNISKTKKTIGAYTTTRDCISQGYPWRECISALLGFADEVVIVDGGSTDGTWDELQKWAAGESRLVVKQISRDWNDENFSLYDGLQKAEARKLCKSDFLWQSDVDEIVHEKDYDKIRTIVNAFPNEVELLALPVIEYWGSNQKVRVDVNPWKWRLSRNNPRITHGIPKTHQKTADDGTLKSRGSDGTDYVFSDTNEPVPFATFYQYEIDNVRNKAISGDFMALNNYQQWCNSILVTIPGFQHFSWFDIERKIKTYKNYWSRHWTELFSGDRSDTAENNMFFDKPWSEVTGDDIRSLSDSLEQKMGGWIFHRKVDFSKPTPWVTVDKSYPKVMDGWIKEHKKH